MVETGVPKKEQLMPPTTTTPPEAEAATVAAIRRGLEDMAAGRVVPHEAVMAELRVIIRAAAARRSG
jgi:hypothetical protein